MSSPKLPISENYWKHKGKKEINGTYKNAMVYTHDDLDGIYSAILIKKILLKRGYTILGYGIVNYQDGWKKTTLRPDIINVAVDFASDNEDIDIYVDHHGDQFGSDNKKSSIKTATGSAYEGICYQYNIPLYDFQLHPIDMVDSAKYKHYNSDIKDILYFDWDRIKKSTNPKLSFVSSFNQLIRRACHATLIETIHNTEDISIYSIYSNYKKFYSGNKINKKTMQRIEFIEDRTSIIEEACERTRGVVSSVKQVYNTQAEFVTSFYDLDENRIKLNGFNYGYQIIGNLAFVPNLTWANAPRARAILEEDIINGIIPNKIDFILLQYGDTLQMVCYDTFESIPEDRVPKLKDGNKITSLGDYMNNLLDNFKKIGYVDINTRTDYNEDSATRSGGHKGIGSISCISSKKVIGDIFEDEKYQEVKWLDVFLNKIISDISTASWENLDMRWSKLKSENKPTKTEMDYKVILIDDIRTSSKQISTVEKKIYDKQNS